MIGERLQSGLADWVAPPSLLVSATSLSPIGGKATLTLSGGRSSVATGRTPAPGSQRVFHNQQDVELVSVDATTVQVGNSRRITKLSNEPEADPLLGGFFIGDYIEVFAYDKDVWVHFNANYRSVRLLGDFAEDGVPVPQQDNFLTTTHD